MANETTFSNSVSSSGSPPQSARAGILAQRELPCVRSVPVSEVALLLGVTEEVVLAMVARRCIAVGQEFFSIGELAKRWRCSRGTVYNQLRTLGARVLDFAPPGKRGKKAVPAKVVQEIEDRRTKRLS